jgi:hypothetical protein
LGYDHGIMVMMRGAVFEFGPNNYHQFGGLSNFDTHRGICCSNKIQRSCETA